MSSEIPSDIDRGKYDRGLRLDLMLIIGIVTVLIAVELFVFIMITTTTQAWTMMPLPMFGVYIVVIGLLIGIETLGCAQVYRSIKEHRFRLRYYD
ncbi:monomethylamine permease [Methanohalobium evestigatum Z-7303]|uniref:Monomethylamine permease n=1 Tax=Methanohalobium evestigatum (strain ATCC BAA-1072 / DSM 3721 / NBRC 107634 / OCM 161 / Z-7303) TaxID=644295 RepID=D7E9D4_METEZ|nr:hypothetical protein [Methanohalobium evestigatum]ADI74206.1 monomethylamine permease [Methanohalobium evestigatum Z-7303]